MSLARLLTSLSLVLLSTSLVLAGSPREERDGVWVPPEPIPGGSWLRILHTNDVHGHAFPRQYAGENLPPEYLGRPIGSFFSVAAYLGKLRARAFREDRAALRHYVRTGEDPILFLDAGDWYGGALYDAVTEGASTARVMVDPVLDLDATVMGNHAWDYHRAGLERFLDIVGDRFPVLAANLLEDGRRPPWGPAWVIEEVDGVRVGILGVVTESALRAALPTKTRGYEVTDIVESLAEHVPLLRPRCDVLLLLAHVGCEREPELVERMKQWLGSFEVPPIDLVVDGHSHRDLDSSIAELVPVVQADHYGTRLGEVLLELGPGRKPTGRLHTRRIILDGEKLPPPRQMLSRFTREQLERAEVEEAEMARCEEGLIVPALPRSDPRLVSLMGDLVAQAYLDYMERQYDLGPLDVGVMNQGGVRMGLYASGTRITRAALHSVLPFSNTLSLMEVPGDALVRLVERGIQHRGRMSFRGLELRVRQLPGSGDGSPGPRELVSARLLRSDGSREEIQPDRTYRVATSEYLAAQGFRNETGVTRRDFAETDFEAVRACLRRWSDETGALTRKGLGVRLARQLQFVE